ncbi:hypothetical protein ASD65_05030 [Microbacterium sp. Root61]|nr:hypothetical protein ASD65_05030 [Microbacterium sp. Root61]
MTPHTDLFQIAGLPLHPLIVHVVVVLTPLTVLALLLGTFWPAARRRLGLVTPLAALAVLVLVPITVLAGESLRDEVGPIPAVLHHEALGRMLLPWTIALFIVTAAQWVWFRFFAEDVRTRAPGAARAASVILAVLSVVVGAGTMTVLLLIGESGARAVWGGLLTG